jgi:hypothetical protein
MKIKKTKSKLVFIIAVFTSTTAVASGADTFEGYSLVVKSDDSGICPLQYRLPYAVDVFVA